MRLAAIMIFSLQAATGATVTGVVTDPQGRPVPGATIVTAGMVATTGITGRFVAGNLPAGHYEFTASAAGFESTRQEANLGQADVVIDFQFRQIEVQSQSLQVEATTLEPSVDMRNAEVFNRTLFSRDDQVFQQLAAGIDAGQHEGGGKSLEIRRFGFNLDHGGVNGGLKVLVDNVQQNQGTQGHGQGYLGSLKSLSPELIQEVTLVNGPFSPEYGDFSGLGVVHIRQRESLPDTFLARLEGGRYNTGRGFFGWSPNAQKVDSYVAYEGTYTDGPFLNQARYRRDNINANYSRRLKNGQKLGFRMVLGRNNFYSSGQLPLDLVESGQLDRFGYLDPSGGGRVKSGTASGYYAKSFADGASLRADGFVSRSLFDLYSNFTFYLNDPLHGDAFQQHDSRLQEGANVQYARAHHIGGVVASFVSGANFHDNQINVGLYPREGRTPTGVSTRANAHVTNEAGYAQESLSLWRGKLGLTGGIRYDEFRYDVRDRVDAAASGVQYAGRWQGKGGLAFTPLQSIPLTLHVNYGRGINSVDARGVVQHPEQTRLATTDFYQAGASFSHGPLALSADAFRIDHSNEQVYIPDDGSVQFRGASRSLGYEGKASVAVTRKVSLSGGVTKISNAWYRGGDHRVYVDSAPHFTANAGLTVAAWRGWSGSLRMRAINHYRLDGDDASIVAQGYTGFDFGVTRRLNHRTELNLTLDNLLNRSYYETQNYFESRVSPLAPAVSRIHGTPGYPLTAVLGITMHLGGK